jgi:hypothetical protein
LTIPGQEFEIELPVLPLFKTSVGLVIELVFWSENTKRWIHAVSEHFERNLPEGHIQVTVWDMVWLKGVVSRLGVDGLRQCVGELEYCQTRLGLLADA